MRFFLVVISLIALLNLLWWRWADRCVRPLRKAKLWRRVLGAFMVLQVLGFAVLLGSRWLGVIAPMPMPVLIIVYVWHLLVLPVSAFLLAFGSLVAGLIWAGRWAVGTGNHGDPPAPGAGPTRRQLLLGSAAAVPPLLAGGSVGMAMAQRGRLRIRPLTVGIPDLPAALDGLTVAQVSDVHAGRLTRPADLDVIVRMTNALKADLVLMTGDLIDFSLRDLPAAIAMVRRLQSRFGLFMCEGNHDLFEDRWTFEDEVREAGVELLLNQSRLIHIRGQAVQILGLRWGAPRYGRSPMISEQMGALLKLRRPDAFPVLLAHHPHAFDPAADAGIPVTLSGHTHGGQLMLTQRIGPGPLLFRYWSGLYRRGRSSLVVSNGVGNWFPMRINAPAEIIHVTLRRA